MKQNTPNIHYESTTKDESVVSAIREQAAPFKGMMSGPEARGGYDEMIGAIPAADDVVYESGEVGGVFSGE